MFIVKMDLFYQGQICLDVKIDSLIQSGIKFSIQHEFICRLNLAQCLIQLGRYSQAIIQIDILGSLPLSPETEEKLKKQLKQLAQLKKKLLHLANSELSQDSLMTLLKNPVFQKFTAHKFNIYFAKIFKTGLNQLRH